MVPSVVKSFNTGVDLSKEIQAFCFRLETELLRSLSYNNQISFVLDLTCDLLGDTSVELSINGQSPSWHVAPSFTDSLMDPVVTADYKVIHGLAKDFDTLMQEISENDSTYGGGIMKTGLL